MCVCVCVYVCVYVCLPLPHPVNIKTNPLTPHLHTHAHAHTHSLRSVLVNIMARQDSVRRVSHECLAQVRVPLRVSECQCSASASGGPSLEGPARIHTSTCSRVSARVSPLSYSHSHSH